MDQPTSPGGSDAGGVRELADVRYDIGLSTCRVRDMPERIRPREEMERRGADGVSDAVLLAVLLRVGTTGVNVVDLAQGLLRRYGSFSAMASASVAELSKHRGMGPVKAQTLKAALEIGQRIGLESLPNRYRVRTPEDAARLLQTEALTLTQERFWVLHLDTRNYLVCQPVAVSTGTLDSSPVHPREVFKGAVSSSVAAVLLAHNHPSGDPTPSAEDVRVTRQLVDSGRTLGIRVLDHVILGKPGRSEGPPYLSLREAGLVDFA